MRRNKIYSFTRLIDKYTIPFSVETFIDHGNKDLYDDLGNKISSDVSVKEIAKGALIPPSNSEIYESGGRITRSDRMLYMKLDGYPDGITLFAPKTRVVQRGFTYFVEGDANFEDFGDFHRYVLKGVDVIA